MSSYELPESLKIYRKYLLRAEQYDKSNPMSSYFIRMFVVTKLIQLPKDPIVSKFAGALMSKLEQVKPVPSQEQGYADLKAIAEYVFDEADLEDKSGNSGMKTAQLFTTAFVLFEVLDDQFKKINKDPEDSKRCKYAQQRAVEIAKQVSQGGQPSASAAPAEEDKPVNLPPAKPLVPEPKMEIAMQMDLSTFISSSVL